MGHLIRGTAIGALLALLLVGSALAAPDVVQVGNLVLSHDGGISPTRLPRSEPAPIDAFISAEIGTKDGSHLPAARELVVDLDRDIHVNARGLPVCNRSQLESRDTSDARRVCGDAIVGEGSATAEIAFPEQTPIQAKSPLLMFNGGVKGGRTMIFIHAFITVPVPAAVVATVELTPIRDGRYGTHVVAKIPPISGGSGSLTAGRLSIGRKFTYKGKRRSYLTASCSSGRHQIRGRVLFQDQSVVNLTRLLPCTAVG